jgi:GNAT superfamily N-acetyltransferase
MAHDWSPKTNGIAQNTVVRAVGLDDWSAIRQLHALVLKRLTGILFDEAAATALQDYVGTPDYTDELSRQNMSVALVDGHIVGTCGWIASDDHGRAARITALFMDPLFTRLGIGRRLVWDAEARARTAGFQTITTRATDMTAEYFAALGYEVSSQGIVTPVPGLAIPVLFMRKRDATAALLPDAGSGAEPSADDVEPPETPKRSNPGFARAFAYTATRH